MTKRAWLAVYKQYGAASIGSVLGVPAATVRRWAGKGKSAGLPASRVREIETLVQIRRHEGYEEKVLREMMQLAKEAGKLPRVKSYSKRREGLQTTGYEVSKPGSGMLNEATLLRLRRQLELESVAKGLPNWIASVQMSVLASDTQVYLPGKEMVQVDHPEANDFVLSAIGTSGLQHSRRDAIDALIGDLRARMKDGARYFIHGSYFSTYEYKTPSETYELKKRRKRK